MQNNYFTIHGRVTPRVNQQICGELRGGGGRGSVQVYGGRQLPLRATDKVITKEIESLIEVETIQILFYICKFG